MAGSLVTKREPRLARIVRAKHSATVLGIKAYRIKEGQNTTTGKAASAVSATLLCKKSSIGSGDRPYLAETITLAKFAVNTAAV